MDLARLSPGDLPADLGYLHLVALLGVGCTGRSFRAETRGLGGLPRVVAVTVLDSAILQDQLRWRDLQTEVDRASTLRHRGAVRTFSLAVEEGVPYVITEVVEGFSLDALLERGGLIAPKHVLDVGIQVLAALGAAHEPVGGKGAVPQAHGEIRPSAVMLGLDGVVKLRGFGLSKVLPSRPGPRAAEFASPEALAGQRLSVGTDLFSLGALLFHALTGNLPFPVAPGCSSGERLAAIVKGLRGGGVLSEVDAIAPGLGKVLGRMLCLDPSLRFNRTADAEAAFREVRGSLPRSGRLSEVLAERFGRDMGLATGDAGMSSPVSDYLNVDPAITSSRAPLPREPEAPTAAESRIGMEAPAPEGPVLGDPGRQLGQPAPPPIPVPRREIVDAPRSGPAEAHEILTTAPLSSSLKIETEVELADELSVDLEDEETTDPGQLRPPPPPRLPSSSSMPPLAPNRSKPARPGSDTAPFAEARSPVAGRPPRSPKGRPRSGGRSLTVALFLVAVLALAAALLFFLPQLGQQASTELEVPSEPPSPQAVADSQASPSERADGLTEADPQLGDGEPSSSEEEGLPEEGVEDPAPPPEQAAEDAAKAEERARKREERREQRRQEREERLERERREAAEAGEDEDEGGGPVSLSLKHSPLRSARAGASELITVRLEGPRSSKVVVHHGLPGGSHKRMTLRAKSGGRWEGWLDLRGLESGGEYSYWVVATHPRAASSATSGSRSSPHRIRLQ